MDWKFFNQKFFLGSFSYLQNQDLNSDDPPSLASDPLLMNPSSQDPLQINQLRTCSNIPDLQDYILRSNSDFGNDQKKKCDKRKIPRYKNLILEELNLASTIQLAETPNINIWLKYNSNLFQQFKRMLMLGPILL